jgi:hypothetical protein
MICQIIRSGWPKAGYTIIVPNIRAIPTARPKVNIILEFFAAAINPN